jgi:excisionase family DNA binding protein
MNINDLITKRDLNEFKNEVFSLITQIKDNNKDNSQWFRTKDAMSYLNVSNGTLQNLRNSGKLKFKKVGGTVYYCKSELDTLFT